MGADSKEKTMDGISERRKAARVARKKVEDAEKKYGRDWEVLLDAKDKEQNDPSSPEAQAAHRSAINELNKDRHTNNGLIDEWLKLSGEAREADKPPPAATL
jgi:hypothetical protein